MVDLIVDQVLDEYKNELSDMTPRQLATLATMRGITAGMESIHDIIKEKVT